MREDKGKAVSAVLVAVVVGCSGGVSEQPDTALPALSPAPSSNPETSARRSFAGEAIMLAASALPAKLRVDGSVTEWGLDGKRNAVTLGIDAAKVVLAIGWAEPKRPVISLALSTPAPLLPEIGWSQRGGSTHDLTAETCAFEQIPLIEAGWTNGRRQPPEVERACLAVLARYQKTTAAYRERFVRRLRIDGDAVAIVDGAGAASPISGAVVRSQGTSAEVELPLSALPELSQAPLAYLLVGAAFGELPDALRAAPLQAHPNRDDKPVLDAAWTRLALETPVGFGEHPDILAAVFTDASGVLNGGVMSQLSYAPARPDKVTTITVPDVAVSQPKLVPKVPGAIGGPTAPDRPALSESEDTLFTAIDSFDKVTVGLAIGSLVTLVGGKLVAQSSFGKPEATQRRGADLHLFRFDAGGFSWVMGYVPPVWRVSAIKPDGAIVDVADEGGDGPGMHDAWDSPPKTFNTPDWTSFGLRGRRNGKPKTVTWQWNAKESLYQSVVVPNQSLP